MGVSVKGSGNFTSSGMCVRWSCIVSLQIYCLYGKSDVIISVHTSKDMHTKGVDEYRDVSIKKCLNEE